jgi:GMP synthase-like glutamine amidotransferase
MIIGLLEAETLPPDIAARFGSYGEMFARLLQPLDKSIEFRYYAADQGQLPRRVSECDAYVVTGSRHNAYDRDSWIENLKAFIRDLHRERRKCLGICFGHQVVAQALGGEVRKSPKGWGAGIDTFKMDQCPPWLEDCPRDFNILVSHQDQVEVLPDTAIRFAHSDFCPNGGYFIGQHIFCLQGHPEFSRDYVRFLIEKRRERIGPRKADQALKSLDLPVRQTLFQGWIGHFVSR